MPAPTSLPIRAHASRQQGKLHYGARNLKGKHYAASLTVVSAIRDGSCSWLRHLAAGLCHSNNANEFQPERTTLPVVRQDASAKVAYSVRYPAGDSFGRGLLRRRTCHFSSFHPCRIPFAGCLLEWTTLGLRRSRRSLLLADQLTLAPLGMTLTEKIPYGTSHKFPFFDRLSA